MEKILEIVDSSELNTLHRLVKEGRLKAVKDWMKRCADDTHRYAKAATPLILAVELNNHQIARALLEGLSREDARRLVNSRRAESLDGPLHIAAACNSMDIVRLLLGYGANFALRNSADERALDRSSDAAIQDLLRSVEQLLRLDANGRAQLRDFLGSIPTEDAAAIMYARNPQGFTALQYLMILVDASAIGKIVNFRREKLKRAAWRAPGPVAELLLHFKRVNSHLSNLDNCLVDNKEPKADLIRSDVTAILDRALEFVNVYKRLVDGKLSEQPLLIIIEECLEYYGSGKSAFTESRRVNTLVNENAPALVVRLLRLCVAAPMRLFMQSACTAEVLRAAEANDLPTLEKCLAGAPRLDQRDAAGLTLLHHALRNGNSQMARLLLNFGAADGDGEEDGKETLLHCAMHHVVLRRYFPINQQISNEVVQMILDSRVGADYVNATRLADGSTALHLAVEANNMRNVELVELLLSRGAMYCAEDKNGSWPVHLSHNYCDHQHCITRLLECCHRLFQLTRDDKTAELLKSMQDLSQPWRLAIGGARDLSGLTLERTLAMKGFDKAAEEMRLLLAGSKGEK